MAHVVKSSCAPLVAASSLGRSPELLLAKYDAAGNRQWLTLHPADCFCDLRAPARALMDSQGNLIIGLSLGAMGSFDMHGTSKYDQTGNLLWTVSHPEPTPIGAPTAWILDQSDNVYFGIMTYGADAAMCTKYDSDGKQLWSVTNGQAGPLSLWYGLSLGLDPGQDVLAAALSTTGGVGILRFQQNLVPGRPIIHGTVPARSVASGMMTTAFPLEVTGTTPLFYQWRRDGAILPDATGAALILTNVTTSDTGNYSLLVTNAIGCAISVPAPLTVVDVQPFYMQSLAATSTNITFHFAGEAGRTYWLEASTNLTDWSWLFGFGVDHLGQDLTISRDNQPWRFFRVRTAP